MGKIEMSGAELVALAGSIAICLGDKFEKEDLRKLRCFFSSISSNIGIIESEGMKRNNDKKESIKK